MKNTIKRILGLFFNNGTFHEYYSNPEEGPSEACHQYCKKCKNESIENTPLYKALN